MDSPEIIRQRLAECEKVNLALKHMCTWIETKEALKIVADARMKIKFDIHNLHIALLLSEGQK